MADRLQAPGALHQEHRIYVALHATAPQSLTNKAATTNITRYAAFSAQIAHTLAQRSEIYHVSLCLHELRFKVHLSGESEV